jgi:hypothetical protein
LTAAVAAVAAAGEEAVAALLTLLMEEGRQLAEVPVLQSYLQEQTTLMFQAQARQETETAMGFVRYTLTERS